ncbi:hypothetical protein D3C72_1973170 [compost metagenome]
MMLAVRIKKHALARRYGEPFSFRFQNAFAGDALNPLEVGEAALPEHIVLVLPAAGAGHKKRQFQLRIRQHHKNIMIHDFSPI